MSVRLSSQMQLAYAPHTDVTGEVWQQTLNGTCTSNGAAGGTTLIDANADSGSNLYAGRYWVHMRSGNNKGLWKRVVADDGAGTLTLENNGFPNQVDSGDQYSLYLSPDPVVVVDSSSGETNMVDTVRADEADDWWNDYYAVPISGTHRGKKAKITDYTQSGGVFVLEASFGSALSAGDVVLLRKFVEVSPPSDGLELPYLPRRQKRVNLAMGPGTIGPRAGTMSFETDAHGSGTVTTDGNIANSSVLSGLFQAVGLEETIGTSTTVTGGTKSAPTISTGSWENYAIGMAVQISGDISFVTGLTDGTAGDDTISVSPDLKVTPGASGMVLNASRLYKSTTDGDSRGVVVEWEVDGDRVTCTGCKGNLSVSGEDKLTMGWEFSVDHWVREIEAAPYDAGTAFTTAQTILATDRFAYADGTAIDIGTFTFSPNTVVTGRMIQGSSGVNGRSGYQITDRPAGGTYQELMDTSATVPGHERYLAGTARDIAVIYGSHGDALCVRMPAARHIEDAKGEDADGMRATPNVLEAQDAGTYAQPSNAPAAIVKIPDFSISLF